MFFHIFSTWPRALSVIQVPLFATKFCCNRLNCSEQFANLKIVRNGFDFLHKHEPIISSIQNRKLTVRTKSGANICETTPPPISFANRGERKTKSRHPSVSTEARRGDHLNFLGSQISHLLVTSLAIIERGSFLR